jgi:hypothetical protein
LAHVSTMMCRGSSKRRGRGRTRERLCKSHRAISAFLLSVRGLRIDSSTHDAASLSVLLRVGPSKQLVCICLRCWGAWRWLCAAISKAGGQAHRDHTNSLKDATVSHPRLSAPVLYGASGRYHSSARNYRGSIRVFRTVCAPAVSGNSSRAVHSCICHCFGVLGVLRRGRSGTARRAAMSAHGTDTVATAVLPAVPKSHPGAGSPLRLAKHLRRQAQLRALFHPFNGRYVMRGSFPVRFRDTDADKKLDSLATDTTVLPHPSPPVLTRSSHHATRDGGRLRNLYCNRLARSR